MVPRANRKSVPCERLQTEVIKRPFLCVTFANVKHLHIATPDYWLIMLIHARGQQINLLCKSDKAKLAVHTGTN